MKILFHSNGVHVGSGYGQQTDIFTSFMADDPANTVHVSAFHGLQGRTLPLRSNYFMLPGGSRDGWGMEAIQIFYEQLKPDATVFLMDAWVCDPAILERVGAIFWTPVDHRPAPPLVVRNLRSCKAVWAMSRFGLRMLRDAGITDAWYVPHGVRTDIFTPIDREYARRKWELPQDAFIVTCVAANKGYPSRKHIPQLLKAWSVFVRTHKDAVLVLHTDPRPRMDGIDVHRVAQFYGIPDKNLHVPGLYALQVGAHEPRHLNELYNAGDVFILPSAGEGFGIPAVEAQASGSPVILTDFTAQSELCGGGWLIEVDEMDTEITLQYSEQAHVSAGQILKALEQAYAAKGDDARRTQAREFALQYDAKRVYERYMLPALREAIGMETAAQRTARRVALRTGAMICRDHKWAEAGLWIDGVITSPCLNAGCSAGLADGRIIPDAFELRINGEALDIEDDPTGGVSKLVMREIRSAYKLDSLELPDNAVVLDIGAHVGIVSCYLAKRFPTARIIAYEPVKANYERLLRNLTANNIANVGAINAAVTGDGRTVRLYGDTTENSGGMSTLYGTDVYIDVPSITLAGIFQQFGLSRVDLLKIDCEGAEYEILEAKDAPLSQIDRVVGEFHSNNVLTDQAHDAKALADRLRGAGIDVTYSYQRMADGVMPAKKTLKPEDIAYLAQNGVQIGELGVAGD